MEGNEELEKLFFELASESRFSILRELQTENLKMNEIARRLDVTATEAFRQLQRLSQTMLVQKQPDGSFAITCYGRLVLRLSSSFEFVSKHVDYFLTHDVWRLPLQFVNRIGELSQARLLMDAMENINRGERMFMDAEEYAWGLAEGRVPELMNPVMTEKIGKGLKLKMLIPESLFHTGAVPPVTAKNVELRGIYDIPAIIGITEKEATVCFRFIGGRIDYAGFSGNDPTFLNWAKDLFLYYWRKGKRT
jgi:predicted transcriptional regulator